MTWRLTVRSNPGSVVTADYECPVHGRFEAVVERDANGDPQAGAECPQQTGCIVIDEHGGQHVQICRAPSPWVIAAAGHVKVKAGEVSRGKSDARPADRHVMNTECLADGMSMTEFKKRRAAVHRDESLRRVRKALGKTPKVWSR